MDWPMTTRIESGAAPSKVDGDASALSPGMLRRTPSLEGALKTAETTLGAFTDGIIGIADAVAATVADVSTTFPCPAPLVVGGVGRVYM